MSHKHNADQDKKLFQTAITDSGSNVAAEGINQFCFLPVSPGGPPAQSEATASDQKVEALVFRAVAVEKVSSGQILEYDVMNTLLLAVGR